NCTDSAWSPTIAIPADLKEEESVTVTCSAYTPCPQSPPELTWNLQTDSQRQTEENSNLTFTSKIQKNITLSDAHDGFTIKCSVSYPVDKGNSVKTAVKQHTLNVLYAPKDTSVSISPLGLVPVGSWVNLTCSSRANPPHISFSWFKISKEGDIKVADGDFYTFNVTKETQPTSFYCVASNALGNQTSRWNLTEPADFGVVVITIGIFLGAAVLCLPIIIYCWHRSKCSDKFQRDTEEPDYVNIPKLKPKKEKI
ncbi:V-set and immunoglobulin domain-containing protein 1, partial [Oryzias melastigma]|uniref:V-set and immunoglobulin domain-containing protein 1 n=1 Tax=Oryzias melastigma TaxID=30732 RepID=UPI00168D607E